MLGRLYDGVKTALEPRIEAVMHRGNDDALIDDNADNDNGGSKNAKGGASKNAKKGEIKDVMINDLNLESFREDSCLTNFGWMVTVISTYSFFLVVASDIWTLYSLYANPLLENNSQGSAIIYCFLVTVIISFLMAFFEIKVALMLLRAGDLSRILIYDLSCAMFQARGLPEYGLSQQVFKRVSWLNKLAMTMLNIGASSKRLIFIDTPQTVILIVVLALKVKSNGQADSKTAGTIAAYVVKLILLSMSWAKLFTAIWFYPCVKCMISTAMLKFSSYESYCNSRTEEVLLALRKDPKHVATPQA